MHVILKPLKSTPSWLMVNDMKIMKPKEIINDYGFTMVEMLVAASMVGLLFMAGGAIFDIVRKDVSLSRDNMIETLDNLYTEQIIKEDILHAKHSLNSLSLPDDMNRNFFDFTSDISCVTNCKREFNLYRESVEGAYSKTISFIVSDGVNGEELMYNPVDAYSKNSLEFKSLNHGNFFEKRYNSPWRKNKLVYLYASRTIRVKDFTDGSSAPHKIAYMGWVPRDQHLGKLIPEDVDKQFISIDPRDKTRITSSDKMLRRAPYVEGLGNFVFISAVKIVRYKIQTIKENGVLVGKLLREVKLPTGEWKSQIVGHNINMVSFYRETIDSPSISVEFNRDDNKKKEVNP